MAVLIRKLVLGLVAGAACAMANACAPRSSVAPSSPPAHTPQSQPLKRAAKGPIRRVVLITIDGLMPDTYLRPDELGLKVPTLRWLKQTGASSDGVLSVFPTLTYPSHTSIATGVLPSKHRIVTNRSFDPMEDDLDGWRWYSEDIAAKPIWQAAEEHGLRTAIVYWPVTVGAKVHWRIPEFWRAANEQDRKLQRVIATPGLLDAVALKHPDFFSRFIPPAVQDDALADVSVHLLSSEKPELLMMHLVEVDTAQHRYGVGSSEAYAAIEKDDAQVGRVVRALQANGLLGETAVVVASDHGFRQAPHAVRPCTLLTEAGLVTQAADKIVAWKANIQAHAGLAYLYVKDHADTATMQQVRQIFGAKLAEPTSGIAKVFEREELKQLGGDERAELALGAAPGYQFAPGCRGSYHVESNKYVATHGFDPRDPDMRASLLMVGPSIPHGTIPDARLIDIAPTIAEWLRVPLPDADGKVLRVEARP